MAHNFKILNGNKYISKSGHDSNDGLTPETPKKSLSNSSIETVSTGQIAVVGAGHYIGGNITFIHRNLGLVGDGKVIIENVTFDNNTYYYKYNGDVNIEFRNCNHVTSRECNPRRLILKNTQARGNVSGSSFSHSIFINSSFGGSPLLSISSSIAINMGGKLKVFNDSYADVSCDILFGGTDLPYRCNYRGVITLAGTDYSDGISKKYAIQDTYTGTPQDNGFAPGVKWLNTTNVTADGYTGSITSTNINECLGTCINREPMFNNESIEDFTLQAASPHIGRGVSGSNIGGTELAITIVNSDTNQENLEIIPSPEIDTTNINSFKLKTGFIEGYIDYIQKVGSSSLTLGVISPIGVLNFNSDYDGGSLENNNVPDSEPSTSDYPRKFTTTLNASDAQTLEISGHDIQIGEFVRVNGEDREVISTTTTNVRVAQVFRTPVISGTTVQVAAQKKLGALNPNRLTYQLRTSKKDTKPVILSDWDNDADPLYGVTGRFLTQEWDHAPGYVIDSNTNALYGAGDSSAPRGLVINDISCKWINLRVFIRNNYDN